MADTSFRLRLRKFSYYLPLAAIVLLGIGLVLLFTRYGAGLGGDATRYILGAENILAGNGYSYISGGGEIVPITSFPPFFPFLLVGAGLTGVDLFDAARILNALLFGGTLFLSGYLTLRYTGSMWTAVIASSLILMSSTMVELFGWAMSEALFMFLMLFCILGFILYLKEENLWMLILVGVVTGLAGITRYVALAQTGAIAISVLLLSKLDWKRRLAHVSIFSILGVAPLVVWFWRNAQLAGTLANRSFIFHPMRGDLLRQYFEEMASWLVPMQFDLPRIRHRLILAACVSLAAALLVFYPRLKKRIIASADQRVEFSKLPSVLLINIACYFVVLFLNSTFLDAGTTEGAVARYLAPVFVLAVILVAGFVHRQLRNEAQFSISHIGMLAIAVILVALYAHQTVTLVSDPTMDLGYVTARMYWTEEIQALQQLDPSQVIISNNVELTYILCGRSSYMIPISFNPNNLETNEDFPDQIVLARERLSDHGVLVIFGYGELDDNAKLVVEQLGVMPQQVLNMAKFYVLP